MTTLLDSKLFSQPRISTSIKKILKIADVMAAGAPCGFKDTWKVWLLSLDPTPERQQSRAGERRALCDEGPSPDASGPSAVKTEESECGAAR